MLHSPACLMLPMLLQVLVADGNQLQELGGAVFRGPQLRRLTSLSLTNCRLQRLADTAFSPLTAITEINLSNNNLTTLSPRVTRISGPSVPSNSTMTIHQLFRTTVKLEQLILSGNQLTQLVPYQFPPLAALQKLDLSHNILAEVSRKSLLNLGQSVRTLDLRGNLLASLHGQLLMPLYKIQVKSERCHFDCHLKTRQIDISILSIYNVQLWPRPGRPGLVFILIKTFICCHHK